MGSNIYFDGERIKSSDRKYFTTHASILASEHFYFIYERHQFRSYFREANTLHIILLDHKIRHINSLVSFKNSRREEHNEAVIK